MNNARLNAVESPWGNGPWTTETLSENIEFNDTSNDAIEAPKCSWGNSPLSTVISSDRVERNAPRDEGSEAPECPWGNFPWTTVNSSDRVDRHSRSEECSEAPECPWGNLPWTTVNSCVRGELYARGIEVIHPVPRSSLKVSLTIPSPNNNNLLSDNNSTSTVSIMSDVSKKRKQSSLSDQRVANKPKSSKKISKSTKGDVISFIRRGLGGGGSSLRHHTKTSLSLHLQKYLFITRRYKEFYISKQHNEYSLCF